MTAVITDPEKIDLLRRALVHITEHPEEWDQGNWASRTYCGTAYCVAGTIAVMVGRRPAWDDRAEADIRECGLTFTPYVEGGEWILDVAAAALGLHPGQLRHGLFSAFNTLDDLWLLAAELTGGAITRPEVTA